MTPIQWLTYARTHRDALHSLIRAYHPQLRRVNQPYAEITAPGAEAACSHVRKAIARETTGMLWPTVRFDAALERGDHNEAGSILNDTWFGVPESTECWGMEGFRQCVALLEDPPEMEGSDGPEDEV